MLGHHRRRPDVKLLHGGGGGGEMHIDDVDGLLGDGARDGEAREAAPRDIEVRAAWRVILHGVLLPATRFPGGERHAVAGCDLARGQIGAIAFRAAEIVGKVHMQNRKRCRHVFDLKGNSAALCRDR
jgi:hypothetical protein